MLQLRNITKVYKIADMSQTALDRVSVNFRPTEFVSILGPSGSGKTTLLNIIGGLDRYDDGDLIINGKSTKQYRDKDWDVYRNHSVGFVFQSYNLIPHQSVLSNVELALTISGVSKSERRRRAKEALEKVGLGAHIHKKPSQMSGGQMQRVAIARALVNDPDILLADEPTGALDTDTSRQIMDLLKEISDDRLIIMVTHNPELAQAYSTRIIKLRDGVITDDSMPYTDDDVRADEAAGKSALHDGTKKSGKTSMSLRTALSLSLNNLMTKKARTFLTSFAGSIGIIGIALILSLSNGIQAYIDSVQKDTLSSYPISIARENVDLSSLITAMSGANSDKNDHELDAVYSDPTMFRLMNSMNSMESTTNDLKSFKKFLDAREGGLGNYVSAVRYSYDLDLTIYTKDENGNIAKSDVMDMFMSLLGDASTYYSSYASIMENSSGFKVWEEMLSGDDGKLVHDIMNEQYDVVYGRMPEAYDEVVLVVNSKNEVSDLCLYALGLKSYEEMRDIMIAASTGKQIDTESKSWSYEEICSRPFRLVLPSAKYRLDPETGKYNDISESETGLNYLYDNGVDLKITGIIRPNEDATASMMTGSIGYTSALTSYIIENTNKSDIVKAQLSNTATDVITGLPFKDANAVELTAAEKARAFADYVGTLDANAKAELYIAIASTPTDEYVEATLDLMLGSMTRAQIEQMMLESAGESGMSYDELKSYFAELDDETLMQYVRKEAERELRAQYAEQVKAQCAQASAQALSAALDKELAEADEARLVSLYDGFMPTSESESTYESNLKLLGYVDTDDPSQIDIYASTFEDKEAISDIIADYNKDKPEERKITYTDYVALMLSSVTTIINAISYVLIAFVAISLVVSSIMIGIITYISVLERTKEIGVLRAIGASKKDVSRVFNAETLIVGFTAGLIGIGVTLVLCIPINLIVHALTGINAINASLPFVAAIALVLISMALTLIAGLFPAKVAAKKDPVIALRSE